LFGECSTHGNGVDLVPIGAARKASQFDSTLLGTPPGIVLRSIDFVLGKGSAAVN
jgi:hypothetical protein